MTTHSLPSTPVISKLATPEKTLRPGKAEAIEEWKRESVYYAYPNLQTIESATPDLTDESDRDKIDAKEENSSGLECESELEREKRRVAGKSTNPRANQKRPSGYVQRNSRLAQRKSKTPFSPLSYSNSRSIDLNEDIEDFDDSDSDIHLSLCPCGEKVLCPWCWVAFLLKQKRTGRIPWISLSFSQLFIIVFIGFFFGYLVHFL